VCYFLFIDKIAVVLCSVFYSNEYAYAILMNDVDLLF